MTLFADNSHAWIACPSAPPVRVVVIERCPNDCQECHLPAYFCSSEAGQRLVVCASMLRRPN